MSKILLILLMLTLSVSAKYTKVQTLYVQGKYKEALQEAKASKKEYANPQLHLLWGHSAKKLAHLDDAMHAYERVLILDAHNKEAQKALQNIYKETDRNALLVSDPSPVSTESSSRIILSDIGLSAGYDSNLNATPGSTVLSEYYGTATQGEAVSSRFLRVTGKISHTKAISKGWSMTAAMQLYSQSNFSAHLYDFTSLSFETGFGYKHERYEAYFPLSYHRVHYLNKDYLEQFRFTPRMLIPISKTSILNISGLYSRNDNLSPEEQARDEEKYGLGVSNYHLFGKHYIYASANYEHRSAHNKDSAKFISGDFFTFGAGASYHFSQAIIGKINYSFRYGRYYDDVGLSVTTRDDNLHQLHVKLSYQVGKNKEVFISEDYSQNRSNFAPSQYTKHSTIVGVKFNY